MDNTQQANVVLARGGIQIEMDNVLPAELEKLRNYFTQLINAQIHRIDNGKVVLHFQTGVLRKIDVEKTVWSTWQIF